MKMQKPKFRVDEIVLVFIVASLAIVVSIYDKSSHYGAIDAEKITKTILGSQRLSFASNGVIDETKLNLIQDTSYYELKGDFDVKNDFCIYIEDENGNVILAKGSPKVINDGIHCVE